MINTWIISTELPTEYTIAATDSAGLDIANSRKAQLLSINKYLLDDYLLQYSSLKEDQIFSFYPKLDKLLSHRFRFTMELLNRSRENGLGHPYPANTIKNIAGYATCDARGCKPTIFTIHFFEILPQFRKHGFGRRLEDDIVKFVKDRWHAEEFVILELFASKEAIPFWVHLGYEEDSDGIERGDVRMTKIAYILTKEDEVL
jgi:GNAT superfamily N-acetyltransferase